MWVLLWWPYLILITSQRQGRINTSQWGSNFNTSIIGGHSNYIHATAIFQCNYHLDEDVEHFQHPRLSLGVPPQSNHYSDFCPQQMVLSILELHIDGIMQYMLVASGFFCLWLFMQLMHLIEYRSSSPFSHWCVVHHCTNASKFICPFYHWWVFK